MMKDALDRIRRREARINAILKNTRYDWLKNYNDLMEKERDRLLSIKKLDVQTAHLYPFYIEKHRFGTVNVTISETYLKKWISWASR